MWFGLFQGEAQIFRDGKITVLKQAGSPSKQIPKFEVGDTATVALGRSGAQFKAVGSEAFVIGLKRKTAYEVEVDGEEMTEMDTDMTGNLEIPLPPNQETGIRIRERSQM